MAIYYGTVQFLKLKLLIVRYDATLKRVCKELVAPLKDARVFVSCDNQWEVDIV